MIQIDDYINFDEQGNNPNKYFEITDACGIKMMLEFNETFIWVTTSKTIDEHKELMKDESSDGILNEKIIHFNKYELKQVISIFDVIEKQMELDI